MRTTPKGCMEQDIGFEPMTFSLATKHSTTELILQNWCPERDSNSQNLASKTNTYTNSVIWAFGSGRW